MGPVKLQHWGIPAGRPQKSHDAVLPLRPHGMPLCALRLRHLIARPLCARAGEGGKNMVGIEIMRDHRELRRRRRLVFAHFDSDRRLGLQAC